jgi:peroxiredoxin
VLAVREQLDRFGDAIVAVVTFAAPERLAEYRSHLDLPFTVASDVDRSLYAALGVGRGTRRQVWSVGTIRLYARLLRQGRRLTWPTEDISQLGADVVVGRDGRIRYISRPSTPAGRASVDELIDALDRDAAGPSMCADPAP